MDCQSKGSPTMTLDEVQRDAESLMQQAQLASSEVESLKEQLAAEKKSVSVASTELEELKKELEKSKNEAEYLRFVEKSFEDRYARSKLRLELEDTKNTIAELREEVAYKSSVNRSLGLQLEKTIESNSELLLEIKDLDDLLQSREKDIEELQADIRERQKEQSYEDDKVAWMQKLEERELEIEKLKEIISKLEDTRMEQKNNRADGDLLKRELEKTETELAEISKENMNLMSHLMELRHQTEAKEAMVKQLELQVQDQSSLAVEGLEKKTKELQNMVIDLQEKLFLSEDLAQSQLESNKLFLEELRSTVEELRARNEQLEALHKSSEERIAGLMEELHAQREENLEHEKERLLLMSQRGQLKTLRDKIATLTESYEAAKERAEGLELANLALSNEKSIALNSLEQQLKDGQDKLQEQLKNVEQSHAQALKHFQTRDLEVAQLTKSLEAMKGQLQEARENLEQSEATSLAMDEKLQSIQKLSENQSSHIADLQIQLSCMEEKLKASSECVSVSEQRIQTLQNQNGELAEMLQASMSLQEEVACRLESLKTREIELHQELQEKVHALRILGEEKAAWDQAMAELKDEVDLVVDNELIAMGESKEEEPLKILRGQLEGLKASIHTMKLEKQRTEASLQQLQADNTRLAQDLEKWKAKVEIGAEQNATSKGKNKAGNTAISRVKSNTISLEEKDSHTKGAKKGVDADQKTEVTKLRKLAADLRRKLLGQEDEKEDIRKKLALLQKEVQRKSELLVLTEKKLKERDRDRVSHKTLTKFPLNTSRKMGAVADLSMPQGATEAMIDLMERIKALEGELHVKTVEFEAAKFVLKQRRVGDSWKSEKEMMDPVEEHADILNNDNQGEQDEDAKRNQVDSSEDVNKRGVDTSEVDNHGVKDEDVNKGGVDTSEADSETVLNEDVNRGSVDNLQMDNHSILEEDVKKGGVDTTEADNLEVHDEDVNEGGVDTSEADNQGVQDEDVNKDGIDTSETVVESLLLQCEGTGTNLQEKEELREMKERYSQMSLQCVQLQAEREELLATIKNLRRENFNMVFLQKKPRPKKLLLS